MSDIKKFLDSEGVKLLWSKVNMQDYPNNNTLMAILDAIDETKADKDDLSNYYAKEEIDAKLAYAITINENNPIMSAEDYNKISECIEYKKFPIIIYLNIDNDP